MYRYNTIQYNTIQYNTIQCNAIQYNTIQYNKALIHSIIKIRPKRYCKSLIQKAIIDVSVLNFVPRQLPAPQLVSDGLRVNYFLSSAHQIIIILVIFRPIHANYADAVAGGLNLCSLQDQ